MALFKKIFNLDSPKKHISFFIIFFLSSNFTVFGSDNKSYLPKSEQKYDEIEKIYKLKSTPYREYDNFENQLKIFFGLNSKTSETNNYPDLSIIDISDALRDAYRIKFYEMTR